MAKRHSSKLIDITGMKFGLLTAVRLTDLPQIAGSIWECVCDCGNVRNVPSAKLRGGKIVSCGCQRALRLKKLTETHGFANKTRTYRTWKEMRQRCMNPNSDKWKWYGARGVTIDPSWDSFQTFLSDMGERPEGHSLDRINPYLGYSKENCRWATQKQQMENTRKKYDLKMSLS